LKISFFAVNGAASAFHSSYTFYIYFYKDNTERTVLQKKIYYEIKQRRFLVFEILMLVVYKKVRTWTNLIGTTNLRSSNNAQASSFDFLRCPPDIKFDAREVFLGRLLQLIKLLLETDQLLPHSKQSVVFGRQVLCVRL
jgi:hypothetical protein